MESLGSSIRSAAQATYSAYRRVPVRWRLAGGSAVLTLVILCIFAVVVGTLMTRNIRNDFEVRVTEGVNTSATSCVSGLSDRSPTTNAAEPRGGRRRSSARRRARSSWRSKGLTR